MPRADRFLEIDALRGTAVLMMIVFHTAFDLQYFGGWNLGAASGAWFWFARLTAGLFVFLAGVSLAISRQKAEKKLDKEELRKKYLKRGLKLFGYGLAITAFTYVFFPQEFIVFGVLHFIGVSIILAQFFYGKEKLSILTGFAAIIAGFLIHNLRVSFPWLLWLGISPSGFASFDYFPLLPWFGLLLVGMWLGEKIYAGDRRKFDLPKTGFPAGFLSLLGRNSLIIYFVHQPVLVAIVILLAL